MAIYLGTNKVDGSIIVDPGSEVSYIPTVQSGTELGKLNIDGFNSSIYAPTIPTNVSAFTNDAGYGAVVELTQAEYDALSTVEKNNGKIYYVTDATGTYLTAGEVSCRDIDGNLTNVQDVVDGLSAKRIMGKTISGTTGNFGEINLNMPNDTYIILSVFCTSHSNYLCIPYTTGSANAACVLNLIDMSQKTNIAVTVNVFYYLR